MTAHVSSTEVNGGASRENGRAAFDPYQEPATPQATPLPHVGVDIAAVLPPIPWLCAGLRLAGLGGVVGLSGYGFAGKTMVAQSIALSIATGRPVFGVHACERGRVLHLDFEQGWYLSQWRYQRLARAEGITEPLEERLRLLSFPSVYINAKGAEDVFAATFGGFDFVVIDSFRAAAPGLDENSSDAREPLDMLTRVGQQTRTVVLVLFHEGKPSEDRAGGGKLSLRGSSALYDALFGHFTIVGDKGEPKRLSHRKEKYLGKEVPDFGLLIEDAARPDDGAGPNDPQWGLRVTHLDEQELNTHARDGAAAAQVGAIADAEEAVVALLTNQPSGAFVGNRAELRAALGIKAEVCSAALRGLEAARRVVVSKGDGGGTQIALIAEGASLDDT